MATKRKQKQEVKYIYQIPYKYRSAICKILDVGGEWRLLAGEVGISVDDIKLYEYQYQQPGGSPTDSVLTKWGHRNAQVEELFKMLKSIQCNRALEHLRGLVPDSYFERATSSSSRFYDSTTIVHQTASSENSPYHQELPLPKMPGSKISSLENESYVTAMPAKMQNFPVEGSYSNSLSANSSSDSDSLGKVTVNHTNQSHHRRPLESVNHDTVVSNPDARLNSTNHAKLSEQDATLRVFNAFPYSDILVACNNFHIDNLLGAGGFGEVFKGELIKTKVAVKVMKPRGSMKCAENMLPKFLFSEIQALLRYRQDNIIPLFGYSVDGPKLCLIYQFMTQGSLEDRLACKNATKPLSWATRMDILIGSARGLNFLHTASDRPLVHGDIKSANILLDKHFEPKIADFGLANTATSGTSGQYTHVSRSDHVAKVYGSRAYLPEEFFRTLTYSVKTDIFSFGVVIYEVCTGDRAHDPRREGGDYLHGFIATVMATNNRDKLLQIRDSQGGAWTAEGWLSLVRLGAKCTPHKKAQRPDMKQVLDALETLSAETHESMKDGAGSDPESSFNVTHQDQGQGQTLKGQGQQMDNIPGVNLQRMAMERIKLSKAGENVLMASDPEKLKMLGLEEESNHGSLSQIDLVSDQKKMQEIEEFDQPDLEKPDKSASIPYLLQQQYDFKSAENSVSHDEASPDLDTPVPVPGLNELTSTNQEHYVNYPHHDEMHQYQDSHSQPLYVNDPSWNRDYQPEPTYSNINPPHQPGLPQECHPMKYPQGQPNIQQPPVVIVTPQGSPSIPSCPIHEDCKSQVTECIQNLRNLDLDRSYSMQYDQLQGTDAQQLAADSASELDKYTGTAEMIDRKQKKDFPDFMQAILGEEDQMPKQTSVDGAYPDTYYEQTPSQTSPPVYAVSQFK